MTIHEIEIVLSNLSTIPGRINPDFLRYNEIVDPDWDLERPIVLQPGHSRIQYGNGLSFSSTDESVTISQNTVGKTLDEIVCPEVAERYLRASPGEFPFMDIEINPSGYLDFRASSQEILSSPLHEIGTRISFKGTVPALLPRIVYDLPDKRITLFIAETTGAENNAIGLNINGEILREVDGYNFEQQILFFSGVLGGWTEDIKDLSSISSQFGAIYISGKS